jgi:hypothetical protein
VSLPPTTLADFPIGIDTPMNFVRASHQARERHSRMSQSRVDFL